MRYRVSDARRASYRISGIGHRRRRLGGGGIVPLRGYSRIAQARYLWYHLQVACDRHSWRAVRWLVFQMFVASFLIFVMVVYRRGSDEVPMRFRSGSDGDGWQIGGQLLVGIVVNCYAIYHGLYAFAIHFPTLEWHGLSHREEVGWVNLVARI